MRWNFGMSHHKCTIGIDWSKNISANGMTVHVADEKHIVANICGSLAMQFLITSCVKCEGWGRIQVHYNISKQAYPVFFWFVNVMPTGLKTELISTSGAATAAFEEFVWWQAASLQWYLKTNWEMSYQSGVYMQWCHCVKMSTGNSLGNVSKVLIQKQIVKFSLFQYLDFNQKTYIAKHHTFQFL